MASRATCGSCGKRPSLLDFPVAKRDPSQRVTAVCLDCLREQYRNFEHVLEVRPATKDEDTSFFEHHESLKRKRSDGDFNSRRLRLQTPIPTVVTCRICCEDKSSEDDFPFYVKRGTRSPPNSDIPLTCQPHLGLRAQAGAVCKACIGRSLAAAFEAQGCTATGCFECNRAWDPKFVRLYFSDELFAKYTGDLLAVKVFNKSNFVWCPDPKCGSGGLVTKRAAGWPQVECGACRARMCAACKTSWHPGMSCWLQQATLKYGEGETENLTRLEAIGARMCPGCGVVIEKSGGCPHMNCKNCRKAFIWDVAEPVIALDSIVKKLSHVADVISSKLQPGECEADRVKEESESEGKGDAEVEDLKAWAAEETATPPTDEVTEAAGEKKTMFRTFLETLNRKVIG